MSGSDDSVVHVGVGPATGDDPCDITFTTTLASPIDDVVATLVVGEILDLVSVEEPIRGVIARTLEGSTAGAIARDIALLRNCMEQNAYEAEVLSIDGGAVSVAVRRQ